jgi:TPR repeat protein
MKHIFMLVLMTLGLFANEFEQAVEDYNNGDYIKALNTFYILAKQDDAKSQFNVALIYANGLGVNKDIEQAQKWYEKSAKQGNGAAQYNLAQLYYIAGEKDVHAYEKAKYWYEKSVEAGVKQAYNNLGILLREGLGTKKDEQKAFVLFQKGAELGDSAAQVNAAILYAWGEDVSHDKMKAYENLKNALKSGKSEASEYLDKLCQESAWVCKD